MAQGIEFNFIANARDVVKESKTATDALEDVAEALDEIGEVEPDVDFRDVIRRANDAGEEVEDAFDDAARQSAKELDGIEDALRDVERTARTSGRDAGRSLDDGMTAGARAAREEVAELKNEAVQNLSETASSFDGSFTSIADGVQGTLGGIVSGLGPVGAAIGLAGAVGLGVVMSNLEATEERAQETRDRAGEIAGALIEAGDTGGRAVTDLSERMRELATDSEESAYTLADVYELAQRVDDLDYRGLATALAGADLAQMQEQVRLIDESIEAREREITAMQNYGGEQDGIAQANAILYDEQIARSNEYRDELLAEIDAMEQAQEQHEAWVAAGGELWEQQAEAAQEASESIQESLLDAGGAYEDFIDEESGIFDTSAYLAAFAERTAAVEAYQANMATASQTLNTQALSYIQSLGVDAAPMLQAYINAPLEQQQQLEGVWASLGQAATNSYVTELGNNMPESIEGPDVTLSVNTTAAQAAIERFKSQSVPVQAVIRVRQGAAQWE